MFMRGAAMRFPIHNLTELSSVFQCVTQSLSSSSTAAPDTKLYELRQYAIRPDSIVKFMEVIMIYRTVNQVFTCIALSSSPKNDFTFA